MVGARAEADGALAIQDSEGGQAHRADAVAGLVVAELAKEVIAPGDQGAVIAQAQAVQLARGDAGDAAGGERSPGVDIHRHGAVGIGAVAELPMEIAAPGDHFAIPAQGQAVVKSARDRHHGAPRQDPTAVHTDRDRAKALQSGFSDFVGKPFRTEELLTTVARLVQNKAIRQD